jgi:Ca2+-binding RTX toxin-like protein
MGIGEDGEVFFGDARSTGAAQQLHKTVGPDTHYVGGPDSTHVTATMLPSTGDIAVDGTIGPDEFDTYSVNVVAGQTYLFSVYGSGANPLADTVMQITDAAGTTVLAFDDDGGAGTNSLITYTATTTGSVNVTVGAYPDSGLSGDYTFDTVEYTGVDTVPDTFDEDTPYLTAGVTYGFIDPGPSPYGGSYTEVDSYAITVEAGKIYTIEMAGGSDYASDFEDLPDGELDPRLALYDGEGNFLLQNDDINFTAGDLSSKISFIATESGTYYLDAYSWAPWTGGYSLTMSEVDPSTQDPVDAITWSSASNIPTVDVAGVPTAYVYFGDSDENFNQTGDDGTTPMVTIDWNNYEKGQIMEVLQQYTPITGITYQVTENVEDATFRLLKTESEDYGAYFTPQDPGYGPDGQGIGVFNVLSGGWSYDQQQSLEEGGYSFAVALHEFGHAHGLSHPHDSGGGSPVLLGVTGAQGSYGLYDLNQGVYTVMSYNDAWVFHPDGETPFSGAHIADGWSGSLSAFDIEALQRRYGVHEYQTGENVYTLSDDPTDSAYYTIWDTGGTDTIAYNGKLSATIDLMAATLDYSPTGGGVISFVDGPGDIGLRGGYTIAANVVIENATGGSGNDVLIGNEVGNKLTGNNGWDTFVGRGGDDIISGGLGVDEAIFSGEASDYMILAEKNGSYKVIDWQSERDGLDQLTSIENFTFSDATLTSSALTTANILRGGAANDDLRGINTKGNYFDSGAGNDVLRGGALGDILIGGAGNDTMRGNGGADQFWFYGNQIEGVADRDRINDLTFADGDQIVLKSFAAGTFVGTEDLVSFSGGTSAVIDSLQDLHDADVGSALITISRYGTTGDNLLLSIGNGAGQVQDIVLANLWSAYDSAFPPAM